MIPRHEIIPQYELLMVAVACDAVLDFARQHWSYMQEPRRSECISLTTDMVVEALKEYVARRRTPGFSTN